MRSCTLRAALSRGVDAQNKKDNKKMFHEISESFELDYKKEKKIIKRIIAYQRIIIEKIKNRFFDSIRMNPGKGQSVKFIKL